MGRYAASDAMRAPSLTACLIFTGMCAGACGDGASKPKSSTSETGPEPGPSAAASAAKTTVLHPQTFRDPKLPGPVYLATTDQVLAVDSDGSTDVILESPGIFQVELLATGDLLLGASTGIHRISGHTTKRLADSLPAMTIELASAGDDDVWALSKTTVHHFDGASWVAAPVPGLKGDAKLRDIAIDRRGVAWLAAGGDGLFEWDGARFKKQDFVKGEVLDVAPSAEGLFALLPNGYIEIQGGVVSEIIKRSSSDVKSGDIATDGSWAVVVDDGIESRSFSIGQGNTQTWGDAVSRLGNDAVWFARDHRGRVWSASKRSVSIVGKELPGVSIPLNTAVVGELLAVEVVGAGPDTLPTEIGPSVSMPIPEGSLPIPSGSVRGNVTINAEPGFADGAVSNASTVIAGMAAGFRRCYDRGLQENPKMKGSLRITAKIGPNGEVTSATAAGGGINPSVVSCLTARVSSATFAKPNGGGATLVIPVSLLPEP